MKKWWSILKDSEILGIVMTQKTKKNDEVSKSLRAAADYIRHLKNLIIGGDLCDACDSIT